MRGVFRADRSPDPHPPLRGTFSPRRREVLLLYFGGHGTAKIANKLGISKQTALNEKSHAIRTLREIFFKKRK